MSDKFVTLEYLNTYEGYVMFLSQGLERITDDILNCNFHQIHKILLLNNLNDVHDIFLSSDNTQQVAPIFRDFIELLRIISTYELIRSENTMSYLYDIICDINVYLNQFFIDRIFSDVYMFHYSLKNSINFLKSAYLADLGNPVEDDGSEVIFFND